MREKRATCLAFLFTVVLLGTFLFSSRAAIALERQDVEFEVVNYGSISGYSDETHFVARTEVEWIEVWKEHTKPYRSEIPRPEIDFSEKMMLCVFMGTCSTTGYAISVERVWIEGEKMHAKIIKSSPPKDAVVGQALTNQYTFISLEKTDLEVTFHITREDTSVHDYIPEFPTAVFTLLVFAALSATTIVLKRKFKIATAE